MPAKIKDYVSNLYGNKKFEADDLKFDHVEEIYLPVFTWKMRYLGEFCAILALLGLVIWSALNLPIREVLAVSLAIVVVVVAFFLIWLEKKNTSSRQLTVIAALIALGVAGRAAFFMFPQFKPVGAIVIISGAILGPEVGFIVGSMTMLISNIFFAQGPWTPWQMIAFGLIGFIVGLLTHAKILKPTRLSLCWFGFISIIVIYGGIMNPASVLMYTSEINWKLILAAYISGAPMDLVHAIATIFFLWFLSKPIIKKLSRIQYLIS